MMNNTSIHESSEDKTGSDNGRPDGKIKKKGPGEKTGQHFFCPGFGSRLFTGSHQHIKGSTWFYVNL